MAAVLLSMAVGAVVGTYALGWSGVPAGALLAGVLAVFGGVIGGSVIGVVFTISAGAVLAGLLDCQHRHRRQRHQAASVAGIQFFVEEAKPKVDPDWTGFGKGAIIDRSALTRFKQR
jgi:hypothetical protein